MPLAPIPGSRKRLHTRRIRRHEGWQREDGLLDIEARAGKPHQLGRCQALDVSTETVRRCHPKWYRGASGYPPTQEHT